MPSRFEELYRTHGALVRRRARAILGDPKAGDPQLQSVFGQVARGWPAFRREPSPVAWLYRATTELCLGESADLRRRLAVYRGIDALGPDELGELLQLPRREAAAQLASWRADGPGDSAPPPRRQGPKCLSDLQLDRLRLGELFGTPDERFCRAHLAECPACGERLRVLEAAEPLPALSIVPPPNPSWVRRFWPLAVGALALLALLRLLPREEASSASPPPADAADLLTVLVNGSRHRDNADVHPGDSLRFELSTHSPGRVVVIGLDAADHPTTYYPGTNNAQPIVAGSGILLPGSVVLDSTPGAERLFAVICGGPIEVDRVVKAGAMAAAAHSGHPEAIEKLDLPCRQATVLLQKALSK